jgi:hypothetical protein
MNVMGIVGKCELARQAAKSSLDLVVEAQGLALKHTTQADYLRRAADQLKAAVVNLERAAKARGTTVRHLCVNCARNGQPDCEWPLLAGRQPDYGGGRCWKLRATP